MKQSKKNSENQPLKGAEGFEAYYRSLYGSRWDSLKAGFNLEKHSVEYKVSPECEAYYLDSASILAALSLPLTDAENILDLCAAPGGKTLVLASRMSENAHLSSNERSPERKFRLATVVKNCLPAAVSERITVSCSDGATWCRRQTECFDAILLDAPCSSERHVIADPKYLNMWSLSRIKTVTTEQWALLSSAYRLLKPDGYLLYSTCALCPEENDLMLDRLIKKFNKDGEAFVFEAPEANAEQIKKFCTFELPHMEKTKNGYQILPDLQNGAGPIYFSLIKKCKSCNT